MPILRAWFELGCRVKEQTSRQVQREALCRETEKDTQIGVEGKTSPGGRLFLRLRLPGCEDWVREG